MITIIYIAAGIVLAYGAIQIIAVVGTKMVEGYERRNTRVIRWTDEEYAEWFGDPAARRRTFRIKTGLVLDEGHFKSDEVDVTLCGRPTCSGCRLLANDPPPDLKIGNPQGERMHW